MHDDDQGIVFNHYCHYHQCCCVVTNWQNEAAITRKQEKNELLKVDVIVVNIVIIQSVDFNLIIRCLDIRRKNALKK